MYLWKLDYDMYNENHEEVNTKIEGFLLWWGLSWWGHFSNLPQAYKYLVTTLVLDVKYYYQSTKGCYICCIMTLLRLVIYWK
jgi:hypothetical protein